MHVRDIREIDRRDWLRLWRQYNDFYQATIPDDVTEHTWARILDLENPILGRVVEVDGTIVGFSLMVLHEGTWEKKLICYLEDLFVAPANRRAGVGSTLISDMIGVARERGCSRIYWHTKRDNVFARRLYDKFATADDFVRYRIFLS